MSAGGGGKQRRKQPPTPREAGEETVRQQIMSLLREQEMGARELSQVLAVTEREVYGHLTHIARSLAAQGHKLWVHQPRCRNCGFLFEDRQRLTRPGRCPSCKHGQVEAPRFQIR